MQIKISRCEKEKKKEKEKDFKKRLKGVKKDKHYRKICFNIPQKMTVVFSNTRGREIFE